MSKKAETARKDARTAGKTAKKNTRRVWRTTTRKGEQVLIDPDGHIYHGTAKEVRDAALVPWRRKMLADGLKTVRYIARHFNYTPEERREYAREKRMDALHVGTYAEPETSINAPTKAVILLEAGSRLVRGDGESFGDYIAVVFQGVIDSLLDVAESVTGKREIPLTRHERAALARLAAAR